MKVDIAGVLVDDVGVTETLEKISEYVQSGRPHQIVTTYSEFVVEANKDPRYRSVLNNAALSVADGVGIIWAAKFLSLPKRDKLTTVINWIGSLASIVLAPDSLRTVIKQQVSGSRIIWDIARLAQEKGYSIALVGGLNGAAQKSADALKQKYPDLKINLVDEPVPFSQATVQKVRQSNSDILLIAYRPPLQELWIAENLQNLNVKVAIGVGGTFDYLSGMRQPAPDFMHKLGLEWFWRLITQPWRIKRMWRAIGQFSILILQFKLKQ